MKPISMKFTKTTVKNGKSRYCETLCLNWASFLFTCFKPFFLVEKDKAYNVVGKRVFYHLGKNRIF